MQNSLRILSHRSKSKSGSSKKILEAEAEAASFKKLEAEAEALHAEVEAEAVTNSPLPHHWSEIRWPPTCGMRMTFQAVG